MQWSSYYLRWVFYLIYIAGHGVFVKVVEIQTARPGSSGTTIGKMPGSERLCIMDVLRWRPWSWFIYQVVIDPQMYMSARDKLFYYGVPPAAWLNTCLYPRITNKRRSENKEVSKSFIQRLCHMRECKRRRRCHNKQEEDRTPGKKNK